MTSCYQKIDSPLGSIHIATDGQTLRILAIGENWKSLKKSLTDLANKEHPILSQTKKQLLEFFDCKRKIFDLPLAFHGTSFQNSAWKALLKIAYGQTKSYSQQAALIGNPKAIRAIGRANGLNPVSIVVPCHRVIGKSGKLTGYASGVDDKKFLLDLEKNIQ